MRIALDVMGGDHAPDAILDGGLNAVELLDAGDELVLIGDESVIREGIAEAGLTKDKRIVVEATTEVIGMAESPTKCLLCGPRATASIVRMAELGRGSARGGANVAPEKACQAIIISAGNTGACVAAAQMQHPPPARRPPARVSRWCCPTFHGPVVVCDVGANPEPRPQPPPPVRPHGFSVYAERTHWCIERAEVARCHEHRGGRGATGTPLVRETNALCRDDEWPELRRVRRGPGALPRARRTWLSPRDSPATSC